MIHAAARARRGGIIVKHCGLLAMKVALIAGGIESLACAAGLENGRDPASGSTIAATDFARRCAEPAVVRCVGFDGALAVRGRYGGVAGVTIGDAEPKLDFDVKASGASSLKFTIPSNSGANSSGSYFTNFADDLSVQFGENQEFYVQWRQRFSRELLATRYRNGGGWKLAIVGTGDQPRKSYASCTALTVVVQNYYQNGFPIVYNSCTGSASHGPYDGFYEPVTGPKGPDFKLQNGRRSPFCLYSQAHGAFFPPTGNCFGFVADEWMTFQLRIKTGPRINDEFVNSSVSLWVARENKPSELVVDWGPYNLTAGNAVDAQRFGKVWLLPYDTGKDPSEMHPVAYTWYDELIISRARIADPRGSP